MDDAVLTGLVAKLDAFAAELSPDEQAVLAEMLTDGNDDVAGFGRQEWPGAANLMRPGLLQRIESHPGLKDADAFLSSGHTSGNFQSSASGRPSV